MLKAYVDSLDAVDEAARGFYKEVTDEGPLKGKFILAVEPMEGFALENVAGLKSALSSERSKREEIERKAREFEGLDPADVRKKLEKYDQLSQIDPNKEADRLAHEKVEAFKTQAQKDIAKAEEKAKAREEQLMGQVTQLLLTSEAKSALAKHSGDIELLLPHIERKTRVREGQDGQFVVEVLDSNGIARIKDASGALMSIEDLVVEMRGTETFGKAFANGGTSGGGGNERPGSGGSGGGTKNPWSKDHFNLTEQFKIEKANPQLAKRLQAEAGAA